MTPFRFILQSISYRRRVHVAVALGVMAATAVLTGALVVGDSVRGSLRHLALDRLGRIDSVLVAPRFFRAALADELATYRDPRQPDLRIEAAPGILLRATLSSAGTEKRTASDVTVLGTDDRFWRLGTDSVSLALGTVDKVSLLPRPGRGEIMLNAPLAEKLGANVGSEIIIRIARPSDIPAESALGRKRETVLSLPSLRVTAVIPATGLGRFGLQPTQQLPYNAFVATATLQEALEQPNRVNAIFAAPGEQEGKAAAAEAAFDVALRQAFKPTLADYGLTLKESPLGYFTLTSDRMLLDEPTDRAAEAAFGPLDGQPTLTYLANYILATKKNPAAAEKPGVPATITARIPYSTIAALDLRTAPPLGPFVTPGGEDIPPLADDQIALNRWAFDDMARQGVKLSPGDTVRIQFFRPESLHAGSGDQSGGQSGEPSEEPTDEQTATLHFKTVVEIGGAAADRNLTPELKGVTDTRSIANWNPPFRFDAARVRTRPPNDQDEVYWERYGALPKAFVSLATGRRLWSSRFGRTTSWRIPPRSGMTVASLTERLQLDPAAEGMQFIPLRQQALATEGTTDFNEIFLYFSFFIIAAAVMLVALLFKLGIDGRADEIGLLLAIGFSRRHVRRFLLGEGLLVAVAGGVAGVAGGVAYAWLMLVGLRTWWLAAVGTPFLQLHATWQSLLEGFLIGVLVSLATIALALRQLRRVSVRQLLAGDATPPVELAAVATTRTGETASGWRRWIPMLRRSNSDWTRKAASWGLLAAVALALFGLLTRHGSSEAQAETFMLGGSLVLASLLILIWGRLRSGSGAALIQAGRWRLVRLAIRNGGRHPLRSTLTIGLMAAATFLIVALSAFRLEPPSRGAALDSGDGGFTLLANSDLPIYQDLNSPDGRTELGLEADDPALQDVSILSLRVHAGDDASCLNLYRPRQPRILGVPPSLVEHGGFAWSDTAAKTAEEKANPWLLLEGSSTGAQSGAPAGPVPVVLDEATATYSLHLNGVGSTLEITAADGKKVSCRVVGLLQNSLFQGDLLMAEADLLRLFPGNMGYRFFLIDARGKSSVQARGALEAALGDYGFAVESTAARLASFMAVQNTYLSTFQSLGGLGLLLGTIGLAVVQLRSVLERRGELALLRAVGFRRRRLAVMVLLENAALLIAGLGTGVAAAVVAILPQLASGGASIPWAALAVTLASVLVVGLAAGLAAVRATLRAPLIPALRGD